MHEGAVLKKTGVSCMHERASDKFGMGSCMHERGIFFPAVGLRKIEWGEVNLPTLPVAVWVRCKDWVIRAVMLVDACY